MLSSILPGVRHVRTPVIVGFLYLGALWLICGGARIVPSEQATSLGERRVAELTALLGSTLWLGVLSLVAVLAGSLLTITKWPFRRRQYSRLQPLEPDPQLRTHMALADCLESRFDRGHVTYRPFEESSELPYDFQFRLADAFYEIEHVSEGITIFGRHEVDEDNYFSNHLDDDANPEVLAAATAQIIVDEEFEDITDRLLLTSDVAFNEIDRHASEAEFRYSIIPPILAILVTLAVTWHWAIVLATLLLLPVLGQGIAREDRSRSLLVRAIALDVVESRTLEAVLRIAGNASHAEATRQGQHPDMNHP